MKQSFFKFWEFWGTVAGKITAVIMLTVFLVTGTLKVISFFKKKGVTEYVQVIEKTTINNKLHSLDSMTIFGLNNDNR